MSAKVRPRPNAQRGLRSFRSDQGVVRSVIFLTTIVNDLTTIGVVVYPSTHRLSGADPDQAAYRFPERYTGVYFHSMIRPQSRIEYQREWRKQNPEKVRASSKRQRSTEEHRAYMREYQRRWRKDNLSKVRGYYEARKTEHNAYSRAWAKRNPEKARLADSRYRQRNKKRVSGIQAKSKSRQSDAQKLLNRAFHRIHRFGLTINEYLDLITKQDFRCAICKQPAVAGHGSRRSLDGFVVDHDHAAKRVRGLLHPNCNVAIGLMQDSPSMLRQAAEYLENQESGDL